MRFGLEINEFDWPGGERDMGRHLADIGRRAEDAGFHSLWVWDHFIQLRGWEEPLLEGWLSLAYLAAATKTIKLGTLVTGVTYRHPAILIKQATTLDVLSGGRAYLGLGAAWNEREHHAFGVEYGSWTYRFELLEDTLQIAHRVWSGERGTFDGKRIYLAEQIDSPPPVQKPHPPILLGGGGERKTLRMVAQYADATHQTTADPEVFRHKLEVLRRHCDDVGRDYDTIEKYSSFDILGPNRVRGQIAQPELLLERATALADAGADGAFFVLPRLADSDSIEIFARVIEQARDL